MNSKPEDRTYSIRRKNFYAKLYKINDEYQIIQKKFFLGIPIKQSIENFDNFEKAEDRFLELKTGIFLNHFR